MGLGYYCVGFRRYRSRSLENKKQWRGVSNAKRMPVLSSDSREPKDYYWIDNPTVGSYRTSVRTPWLSLALAIALLVASFAGIVGGLVMVLGGQRAGWGLVVPSIVVGLPIGIAGTVLASRYYRTSRRGHGRSRAQRS